MAEGRAEGRAEGMAEGIAEGRAEGMAEGMTLGKIEIARSLKKSGMPHEQISLHTGLSEAEIDRL